METKHTDKQKTNRYKVDIQTQCYLRIESKIKSIIHSFFYKKPTAWRVGSIFFENSRF